MNVMKQKLRYSRFSNNRYLADLFSELTTILDELDDFDDFGAMSPDSYLAPDADVEAANMESFLENASQKGTMSDDDDDVAIPKGKSIAHMPSKMAYVSFDEDHSVPQSTTKSRSSMK